MNIERIPELELDPATDTEIGQLLDACFDGGFEGHSYYIQRHHLRLVARDQGRIVGHLALALRTMRQGPRIIDTVTVAEVGTAPDRRGEGIASALLADAIEVARGTEADFMLLFGTAGPYGAAGFRTVANLMRHVEIEARATRGVVDGPAEKLMVLPLREATWDDTTPLDLLGAKF